MSSEKLNCAVVRDIMPLYHDGVVSDITADVVKNHLSECEACRAEYDMLCAELPVEKNDVSTKNKFSGMMKKLKRKRFFVTIIIAILSCAILAGSFFVLTQVPMIDVDDAEIEVIRAYRYEVDGVNKLFVLYSRTKNYDGITFGALETYDEDGTHMIELNEKRTILGQKLDEPLVCEDVWLLEDDGLDDYQVIKFGDTVIWSEDNNTDDKVPDYVYEYDRFESGNYDITWITALDEGYLGAQYPDGSCKYWDIDGNIVYEGKSDVDETPVY